MQSNRPSSDLDQASPDKASGDKLGAILDGMFDIVDYSANTQPSNPVDLQETIGKGSSRLFSLYRIQIINKH